MAKDHYVAQTYLSNFTDSEGQLFPYYKGGRVIIGKPKPPSSVCYRPDGNTNSFFTEPRFIEKFLIPLENGWNENLEKLSLGEITPKVKAEIVKYLSVLRVNTPTAIRQSTTSLEGLMNSTAKLLAARGEFHNEKYSKEFNDEMVARLMNGEIKVNVDPEYAHARNLSILDQLPVTLYYSNWKILISMKDCFLTSDNPLCLFHPKDNATMAWFYAPLKPNMAILIWPYPEHSELIKQERYSELTEGSISYGRPKSKFIYKFNENLVRHAEEKVFFNQQVDWITRLVKLNQDWRAEALVDTLPTGDGYLNIVRHRVRKRTQTA